MQIANDMTHEHRACDKLFAMKESPMLYAMCHRILPPQEKSTILEKMEKLRL